MKGVLDKYYGFKTANMAVLTDYKATKKAMQAGIHDLVKKECAGDVLFLHYSGHGANVPDKDGDEADNRDEILYPNVLDRKAPLTDDWLRTTFDKLRKGVSLTVIMDCCHSGTKTRALLPPDAPMIPRYLPNPWDLMAEESGRKLCGRLRGELRASPRARRKRSGVVVADIPEVLVTGCRATQTSADAYIGKSFNGALTYHLVAALTEAKGDIGYRDLRSKTLAMLKKADYDQVPQLEGCKAQFDRPFLSLLS